MNKKIIPILILIIITITPANQIKASQGQTKTTIITGEDGYISNTAGVYVKDTADALTRTGTTVGGVIYRSYYWFNTSTIPANSYIISIKFGIDGAGSTGAPTYDFLNMTSDPSGGALNAQQTYDAIGNGQQLYGPLSATSADINYTLGVDHDIVCQNFSRAITNGKNWFCIGLQSNDETPGDKIWLINSLEGAELPVPTIYIEYYTTTPSVYRFTDTYYENGTLYVPPVNVTASGPGFVESFNTTGGTTQFYSTEPTLFYWTITDGVTTTSRRVYNTGSENITVTEPENLFDTYVFTVRDFTNKLSLGDGYLEAYRIVNTTNTLIERQIIDIHNEVPLNLVDGATYTIRVLFYDGSTYDWGTFVPGETTTFTIVLRGVAFSDQAYQVSNFITVDITRTGGTLFTIDYETTQNTTTWANVTIQIRNGAIVSQISRTNNTFTYNYAGALANTSYIVLVNGEHTLLLEWGYTRIFDASETYPDIPDLEAIFPLGLLNATNLVGWVLSVGAGGLTYSVNMRRGALMGMATMASILTVFGFTDWSYYLLALVWFFAFMVYLGSGDKS